MNSSWDSYYIVFLSAVLSLGIPAVLAVVSLVFFPKIKQIRREQQKSLAIERNRTILGQRINIRFFLATNAAIILITLALALVPCVTTLQSENRGGLISGLISIFTIVGFSILGLLYSVRKGDMGWLSTFNVETRGNSMPRQED